MVDRKPSATQSVGVKLGAALKAMRGSDPQDVLAGIASVKQPTVSRWERGDSSPTIDQMIAIEDYYERPRGSLLRDAGLIEPIDSTEKVIAADPALTPIWRQAVLVVYRSARADSASAASATTISKSRRK